jgi:hypothetical protein
MDAAMQQLQVIWFLLQKYQVLVIDTLPGKAL